MEKCEEFNTPSFSEPWHIYASFSSVQTWRLDNQRAQCDSTLLDYMDQWGLSTEILKQKLGELSGISIYICILSISLAQIIRS
jgi:hypothetical protein